MGLTLKELEGNKSICRCCEEVVGTHVCRINNIDHAEFGIEGGCHGGFILMLKTIWHYAVILVQILRRPNEDVEGRRLGNHIVVKNWIFVLSSNLTLTYLRKELDWISEGFTLVALIAAVFVMDAAAIL